MVTSAANPSTAHSSTATPSLSASHVLLCLRSYSRVSMNSFLSLATTHACRSPCSWTTARTRTQSGLPFPSCTHASNCFLTLDLGRMPPPLLPVASIDLSSCLYPTATVHLLQSADARTFLLLPSHSAAGMAETLRPNEDIGRTWHDGRPGLRVQA